VIKWLTNSGLTIRIMVNPFTWVGLYTNIVTDNERPKLRSYHFGFLFMIVHLWIDDGTIIDNSWISDINVRDGL
jgi:hypothetical protein